MPDAAPDAAPGPVPDLGSDPVDTQGLGAAFVRAIDPDDPDDPAAPGGPAPPKELPAPDSGLGRAPTRPPPAREAAAEGSLIDGSTVDLAPAARASRASRAPGDPVAASTAASTADLSPTLRGVAPLVELPGGPDHAPASRSFGRYAIEGELGRGGMGVVLLAFDRDLRRHVAMKVLRPSLTSRPGFLDRFTAEAQVTAQLQHPAIVPVFELGTTDRGELYYTMRLVRGRNLAEEVRASRAAEDDPAGAGGARRAGGAGRALTRFRLLEAFVQVAMATAYAHERGVIHRDLKPHNVMIGRFGEVHLLDWGLARLTRPTRGGALGGEEGPVSWPASPRSSASAAAGPHQSTVAGTPAYMAPEQAEGGEAARQPAVDVYALGAILYAILTGQAPYRGSGTEILVQLAEGRPPVPPRALVRGIPEALERICLGALAHDPAARTPSARALGDEVEAYLEGRPERPARPEDSAFLAAYDPGAYRRPSVSVDVVVLASRGPGEVAVALHRRHQAPALGQLALPGGFFELEEPLEAAVYRKLREEAGVFEPLPIEQLATFGAPGRDPRTRVISIAYLARAAADTPLRRPLKRDVEPAWVRVRRAGASARGGECGGAAGSAQLAPGLLLEGEDGRPIPAAEVAFDHLDIIASALARWERAG